MDLTRVSVLPENTVSLLVPSGWDVWTYEGSRFERGLVATLVWQSAPDGWIPCAVERVQMADDSES